MFTGIIEAMGTVLNVKPFMKGCELTIDARLDLSGDRVGDSIAVDGVCLTATSIEGSRFVATASGETVSRSTLSGLRPGSKVNLERAVTLSTRRGATSCSATWTPWGSSGAGAAQASRSGWRSSTTGSSPATSRRRGR